MCFGKLAFLWILWDTFCIQDMLTLTTCEENAGTISSEPPIASMCYNTQASGETVILDVSKANDVSSSECTCLVTISFGVPRQSYIIIAPHFGIQPNYKYCDSRIEVTSLQSQVSPACFVNLDSKSIIVHNNETISVKFYKEGPHADDRYCIIMGLYVPGTISVKCIDPLGTEPRGSSQSSVKPEVHMTPSTKGSIDPRSHIQTSTVSINSEYKTSSISPTEQISISETTSNHDSSSISSSSTTVRTTSKLSSFFTSLVTTTVPKMSKSTETSTQHYTQTSAIKTSQSSAYTESSTKLISITTAATEPTSSDMIQQETTGSTTEVSSGTSITMENSSSNFSVSNEFSTPTDTTPIFVTFIPTSTEKQISSATPDSQARDPKKEGQDYRLEVIIPAAVASVVFIGLFIVLILCARTDIFLSEHSVLRTPKIPNLVDRTAMYIVAKDTDHAQNGVVMVTDINVVIDEKKMTMMKEVDFEDNELFLDLSKIKSDDDISITQF